MRCPKCTSIEDKVIDSRISKEGSTIRRRRECLECSHRYTTTEAVVRDGVVVIKRDGRREEFDREKLVHAVRAGSAPGARRSRRCGCAARRDAER